MLNICEQYRVKSGPLATKTGSGPDGYFKIKIRKYPLNGKPCVELSVVVTSCGHWEKIVVSLSERYPTWEEMVLVRSKFWKRDDKIIQVVNNDNKRDKRFRYALTMKNYK